MTDVLSTGPTWNGIFPAWEASMAMNCSRIQQRYEAQE
jgi:hypothetical protein